jgi:hypothetical protein
LSATPPELWLVEDGDYQIVEIMNFKIHGTAAGIVLFLTLSSGARAQTITEHTFTGAPDGADPLKLAWANGVFYGSTAYGGANGDR